MQSPQILSLGWCKMGTNLYGASNYPQSCIAILGRQCKFPKFRCLLSPWYRVGTKTIFISKRSFRDDEPKNNILRLVQIEYKPLRGFKLLAFIYRHIGPIMQISKTSGLPIAMVPYLHQDNIYIKRKLQGCRAQKFYAWVCAKRVQTPTGLQITRIHVSPYRADNANFRNFGASYRHGTGLTPKQYSYEKEALGMQSPKILSLGWCKKGTNLYGASNYPYSCVAI